MFEDILEKGFSNLQQAAAAQWPEMVKTVETNQDMNKILNQKTFFGAKLKREGDMGNTAKLNSFG